MQGRLSQSYPLNLPPAIGAIVAAASAATSKQHAGPRTAESPTKTISRQWVENKKAAGSRHTYPEGDEPVD